jgi:hypothetical protein
MMIPDLSDAISPDVRAADRRSSTTGEPDWSGIAGAHGGRPMSSPSPRPFTLLDAMVLVAATAIGLGALRAAVGDFTELRQQLRESLSSASQTPVGWSPLSWAIVSGYGLVATAMVPFCWAWTVALVILRQRRPRPPRRRMGRQPGALACSAAALLLVPALVGPLWWCAVTGLFGSMRYESAEWQKTLAVYFIFIPALTGFAVIGAWWSLYFGRRWRPESSWIDRVGRALGVYWIATVLLPVWGLF